MRVLGITPENVGKIAVERGIPTLFAYFDRDVIPEVLADYGQAKIVTATNVFAHIDDVHEVVEGVVALLRDDGIFISESHYLCDLVDTLQYDTVYHEHLRYYSLESLQNLFRMHGLEIVHAKRIPTHGGSIRVYATRKGTRAVRDTVAAALREERAFGVDEAKLLFFKKRVLASKLDLLVKLRELKAADKAIYGISAPSRASTLINYVGIDDAMIDYILEVEGSYKIGNYVPGTRIPIVNEQILFERPPDYAILFSWHIADELMPKLRAKGFRGRFIVPLPEVRIV